MCRYVNDGENGKEANCEMKVVEDKGRPYLCLFATCDIAPDTQLRYDYGDRADNMWWRKKHQVGIS